MTRPVVQLTFYSLLRWNGGDIEKLGIVHRDRHEAYEKMRIICEHVFNYNPNYVQPVVLKRFPLEGI